MKAYTDSGHTWEYQPRITTQPDGQRVLQIWGPIAYNLDDGFIARLLEHRDGNLTIDIGGWGHGVKESVYIKCADILEFITAEVAEYVSFVEWCRSIVHQEFPDDTTAWNTLMARLKPLSPTRWRGLSLVMDVVEAARLAVQARDVPDDGMDSLKVALDDFDTAGGRA